MIGWNCGCVRGYRRTQLLLPLQNPDAETKRLPLVCLFVDSPHCVRSQTVRIFPSTKRPFDSTFAAVPVAYRYPSSSCCLPVHLLVMLPTGTSPVRTASSVAWVPLVLSAMRLWVCGCTNGVLND
eukprot:GHVU01143179.1.p2 GENE.GHVU01143179.1~~GHVU01143179.1.p2  ORF type:complete len:125 (+),score=4.51 GHVU01143179.1:307-681(+)